MKRPALNWPYEWQLGWRHVRGGRAGHRNRFIPFISWISMLGITLGVAALIVVLSVINGFRVEVRDRMLDVVPHIAVSARYDNTLPATLQRPGIEAVAPAVSVALLLGHGDVVRGALLRGIDPPAEARVSPLARQQAQLLATLRAGEKHIVLGSELARALGVEPGDRVSAVLPGPSGAPRVSLFVLTGTVDTGHFEFDNMLALMHTADAQALLGLDGPNTLHLRLVDADQAPAIARDIEAGSRGQLTARDWTQVNRNWFESVQIQRRMLALILTLIVAVAAFNLVSTLVMSVADRRAEIAILRTLGASPASVMGVFVIQGALVGLAGTLGGVVLGLGIAFNVGSIVPAIERVLGTVLLSPSIYLVSRMPSQPLAAEIVPVALVSLLLAFAATLYPSWRASRVDPAQALRFE
jgi:lipoprotein-releasing system permease protein